MALKQLHLLVRGRVQGVFFRASAQRAARRLGLPVIMVERPPKPDVEYVTHIDQVLPWLVAQGLFVTERGV